MAFYWSFEKIIKEISAETGISKNDIKDVIWSEFKMVSQMIEDGQEAKARLLHIGVFMTKKMFIERKRYYHNKRKIRMKQKLLNIIEGWTNVVFINEHAEQMAKARAITCAACPFNQNNICTKCSCPLSAKTRSEKEHCPIEKW